MFTNQDEKRGNRISEIAIPNKSLYFKLCLTILILLLSIIAIPRLVNAQQSVVSKSKAVITVSDSVDSKIPRKIIYKISKDKTIDVEMESTYMIVTLGGGKTFKIDFDSMYANYISDSDTLIIEPMLTSKFKKRWVFPKGPFGPIPSFHTNFRRMVTAGFVLTLLFLLFLIMILGLPILIVFLLYKRWRWTHEERMKAIETGLFVGKTSIIKQERFMQRGVIWGAIGLGLIIYSILVGYLGLWGWLGLILLPIGIANMIIWRSSKKKMGNKLSVDYPESHDENKPSSSSETGMGE